MSANVTLTVYGPDTPRSDSSGPSRSISPEGRFHRFRIATTGRWKRYMLEAARDGHTVKQVVENVRGRPSGLRLVALGDSRSRPDKWEKVARAALAARPDLVVSSGDLVARGTIEAQWDTQFWSPAREMLAKVPFYFAHGNHDDHAPLLDKIFYSPTADGRGLNWAQKVGDVLLIGVDGMADFSASSANTKWLESTLAKSREKFIFLCNHYPAHTSGPHGRLRKDGRFAERPMREAQGVILPLMEKYGATAMIAGHDHHYERSEPPGGVPVIITGGGGAGLRKKVKNARKQNPYSKVFAVKLHYCLFTFSDDFCTMQVLTPEGKLLDERVFKARRRP